MTNFRIHRPEAEHDGVGAGPVNAYPGPSLEFVCAADEAYALPLAVMIGSLLANADPVAHLDVYIIDCGLSAASRESIDSLARAGARFHWLSSARGAELSAPGWGHVTGATYERLMLQDYLPTDTHRVLWLDADLLVLGDVAPLFSSTRHSGDVLSAVRDPFVLRVSSRFGVQDWRMLGLTRDMPYFNAGVMLIDMKQWRELCVANRAVDYLRTYGRSVYFNEQEALNAVVGTAWTQLDDRWNVSANPIHARRQKTSEADAAIVHFSGRVKPWAVPNLGATQDLYFRYLDHTPWRHARPRRTPKTRLLSWYLNSRLRQGTYWLENQHLKLSHFWGF